MKSLKEFILESQNFLVNKHTAKPTTKFSFADFLTWYVKDHISNIKILNNFDLSFKNLFDLDKKNIKKYVDFTNLSNKYISTNKQIPAEFDGFDKFYSFIKDNKDKKLENYKEEKNNIIKRNIAKFSIDGESFILPINKSYIEE